MIDIAVLYVGSSLLAPLRRAERDINEQYGLGLRLRAHNCLLPLLEEQWAEVERDLAASDIVFVIHVTEAENAARIGAALHRYRSRHRAALVINCLRDLMMCTHLGELEFASLFGGRGDSGATESTVIRRFAKKIGLWMAGYTRHGGKRKPEDYLALAERLPGILRFVPAPGRLAGIKHYLAMYCYFLQPTPANIRSMVLYAIKHYGPEHDARIEIAKPESRPVMGIYHPGAPGLFQSIDEYRKWYGELHPERTIGLLLMRPQIVSGACNHYRALIRAIEDEGLSVLAVLSTFMDNRDAARAYFMDDVTGQSRVSQILSLTGFSFVGGPAMNDSKAAVEFLTAINRPLRSSVSLEVQRVEDWAASEIGLNPVQTAMQVAIPEIDGATEPFLFAGQPGGGDQPEPIEDRCRRIARRLARWNRLRCLPRAETHVAFVIYCFPPNKGNLGTAADLDVFQSLWKILGQLKAEGYDVEIPRSPDALREAIAGREGPLAGERLAHVAYRLSVDEYRRLCPHVEEIEAEWGPAPGRINSEGRDILIHGVQLGNAFVGVQPSFGYEGDPMRMLMAKGSTPHHGFMGLYVYLEKILRADVVVHVGTHGALEFMPGKQVGLSSRCWPDRLIGELPNVYIYSVNNPSEGSIAKRRSYAELVSYLTPPVQNAGLYKELAALKEMIAGYRQTLDETQKERLFAAIEEKAGALRL